MTHLVIECTGCNGQGFVDIPPLSAGVTCEWCEGSGTEPLCCVECHRPVPASREVEADTPPLCSDPCRDTYSERAEEESARAFHAGGWAGCDRPTTEGR